MQNKKEFQEEALRLLKDLLAIPSVNGSEGERAIAEYIFQLLHKHQITAELQEIDDHRANVIAFLEGEQAGRTVIWNGHLDTVPYGNLDEWQTEPSVPIEAGERLYARGASDMKSGLAAMIYALLTLKKSGIKPKYSIRFLGTCDEEKGGMGAEKILELEIMKDAQALMIGEPTDCRIGVAQKGCIWLELIVHGKTSHGAYPEEGINAIQYGFEAAKQLQDFLVQYKHPILGASTAQITLINGGIAPNMTPDHCTLLMDIRIVPNLSLPIVRKELELICMRLKEATDQKIAIDYHIRNNRIPIEIASCNEWVTKFKDTLCEKGLPAYEIGINYFTDASILAKDQPDLPVLLFGPGEPNMAHKPNEWVAIDKYYQSIEVLLKIFGGIE